MASSTTNPVANTIPSKVKILIEKLKRYIMKNAPIREIGMATTGIIVVRQSLKKKKITNTTRPKAMRIVSCTSEIALLIGFVLSKA